MLSYPVDPSALADRVPAGCELDSWSGSVFVSVVAFQFRRTRVLGLPIPFNRDFEEVNLRCYVRRKAEDAWRRGVVFVKELVPRSTTAFVARRVYGENYEALLHFRALLGLLEARRSNDARVSGRAPPM